MASICKILACILFSIWLCAFSFMAFWIWEDCSPFCIHHPGIVLVAFGVIGETLWEHHKKLKMYFAWMLIAGLLLEMREAIIEDGKVEELRNANNELEAQQLPMAIGDELSFACAMSSVQNINIIVTNNPADGKAHFTAYEIANAMRNAGWNVTNTLSDSRVGARIEYNEDLVADDNPTVLAANRLHETLVSRNIPVAMWPQPSTNFSKSNDLVIEVGLRPDPEKYTSMVLAGKEYDASHAFAAYANTIHKPSDLNKTEADRLVVAYGKAVLEVANDAFKTYPSKYKTYGAFDIFDDHGNGLGKTFSFSNGILVRASVSQGNIPDSAIFTFSNGVLKRFSMTTNCCPN